MTQTTNRVSIITGKITKIDSSSLPAEVMDMGLTLQGDYFEILDIQHI